jgi:hypothetical protein
MMMRRTFFITKDGDCDSGGDYLNVVENLPEVLRGPSKAPATDDESEQTLQKLLKMQEMLYGLKKEKIKLEDEKLHYDWKGDPTLKKMTDDADNAQGKERERLFEERSNYISGIQTGFGVAISKLDRQIKELELELEHAKAVMQLKRDFGPQSQVKPKGEGTSLALPKTNPLQRPIPKMEDGITPKPYVVGIGLAFMLDDDGIPTIGPIMSGSPADKDGRLKTGDKILGVGQGKDGKIEEVTGMSLLDVQNKIRGPVGSTVRLQMQPADGSDTKIIELLREELEFDSPVKLPKTDGVNPGLKYYDMQVVTPKAFSQPQSDSDIKANEIVWNKFGIFGVPVSKEELKRRTDGMQFPMEFDGVVEIKEVKPGGMFASLKIQKGDLLAAIITPKDPWNIMQVADLKYFAERWTPEQMGGNEVKVIVIRDKMLFEGILPVAKDSTNEVLQKQ